MEKEKSENNNQEKKLDLEKFNKGNHKFRDYWVEHIDTELQNTGRIDELEEFILKPQLSEDGIYSLTEKELELYERINVDNLAKTDINMKTIIICKATQEIIKENKEKILETIRSKKQKEEEDENER